MASARSFGQPSRGRTSRRRDYIDVDQKALKARYLRTPRLEDVPYPVSMEPQLVVEFYSR